MYVLEIKFQGLNSGKLAEISDEIELLLHCLRGNGQILGREYPIAKISNNEFRTYVLAYEKNSLDLKKSNQYVRDILNRLNTLNGSSPTITILGEEAKGMKHCTCETITSYLLYTYYVSLESPLRCLDCFQPIPLYKIPPIHDREYMNILSWETNYQSCDRLQMNCRVGEKFATRQISNLTSQLTRQGLEICQKISEKTTIPTYYYLYRNYCRSPQQEKQRKCPSCSGNWLLEERLHNCFDFQCHQCLLLSNIAFNAR